MSYETLEREVFRLWDSGNFPNLFERVRRFLGFAVGANRGRGLILAANVLYAEDYRNLPRALAMVEEAMPLVAVDPVAAAKGLLMGLLFSRLASDRELSASYAKRLALIEGLYPKEVRAWQGRIHAGLAQYHESQDRWSDALDRYERSVSYHKHHNAGPHAGTAYGERDRRGYLALSLAGCARAHIRTGNLAEASRLVNTVRESRLSSEFNPHPDYLVALIALEQGVATGVKSTLDSILGQPEVQTDHEIRFMALELLARYYMAVGERDAAYQCLQPQMNELEAAGNLRGLLRLQRYIKRLHTA